MECFLGQLQLFAFGFAPTGWRLCDGTLLSIATYQALYTLLGTSFGGNGTTTFGIPNLLGASLLNGMQYYIALDGIYPQRS